MKNRKTRTYLVDEVCKDTHDIVDAIFNSFNQGKWDETLKAAEELREMADTILEVVPFVKETGVKKPSRIYYAGEKIGKMRVFHFEDDEK